MDGKRVFPALLGGVFVLAVVLLGLLLLLPGARQQPQAESQPLRLSGEYALDGSAQRYPLTAQTRFAALTAQRISLYGHFDQAVAPGAQIILRTANLQIDMLVNGREVFVFGAEKPALVRSAGDVWTAFPSGGILPTDNVELTLTRVYGGSASAVDDFLAQLSSGSEFAVYRKILIRGAGSLVVGLAVLLMGMAMLVTGVYARRLRFGSAADYGYLAAFMITSGVWICVQADILSLLAPYPAFWRALEQLCLMLMPVFVFRYAASLVPKPYRSFCLVIPLVLLSAAAIGLVLQLLGATDLAALSGWLFAADAVAMVSFGFCLVRSLCLRRNSWALRAMLPLFILFGGAGIALISACAAWQPGGLFFSAALLAFAVLEMARLVRSFREGVRRSQEFARLENELTQSRIAVMLSQIKPHFLFNALNSISALCLTDPVMADQAITSLSNYLRGNIRSLEQNAPIPFEQELDHIKYYVRLEQLRYGDRLRVVYAIATTDFEVPTLSLQTLVENAIRHGVSPRPEGGLVVVQTERGDGCAYVRIIDDGVGFDPDLQSRNADSIGLANAKKRMEVMMNAEFDIHSVPGKGTEISIRIPDAPGRDNP